MLKHDLGQWKDPDMSELKEEVNDSSDDGVANVNYTLDSIEHHPLFTKINVVLPAPPVLVQYLMTFPPTTASSPLLIIGQGQKLQKDQACNISVTIVKMEGKRQKNC